MADRLDSERLRGFDFRLTDRQTDRQTFAIVESLSRLKTCSLKLLFYDWIFRKRKFEQLINSKVFYE